MSQLNPITTVKIKCKPTNKAFLESNFGAIVFIPEDHPLSTLVNSQLTKDNPRFNRVDDYEEYVELAITKETFRFDGFSINEANTQKFNSAVDKFMKLLLCTSIDALLISQVQQNNWQEKCLELLEKIKAIDSSADNTATIKKMKKEMDEHQVSIKKAIELACIRFLKVDVDVLGYEAVKKYYYRYRQKKDLRHLSRAKEIKVSRQMSSPLNFKSNGYS